LDSKAKAEMMIKRYEEARFMSPRSTQRLRLQLLWWVIRSKVMEHIKYFLDVLLSGTLLIFLAPVIFLVSLAIKLESSGPVFYSQERVGKWGEPFTIYKLRSMYTDADQRKQELMESNDADGPIFKMRRDPRITRIGRIIRKLSIDELPQLYNVLRGEMSLVGPRPAVPQEVAMYHFDQRKRLEVTPGITGLQQISGRSDLDFKRWIELDIQYISERGLHTDIMIMLKTIPAVIFGKGAY
jgi:lipopolysaccharide/colanic/teichoic acid biosynthesis glycosyltransferase